MEGEIEGAQPECGQTECRIVGEDVIDLCCTIVGNQHFLHQSPQDESQSFSRLGVVKPTLATELRQQVLPSFDGTSHQLWEKADKRQELQDGTGGFNLSPVAVNHVGRQLEGVETDAHRQDDVQGGHISMKSPQAHECGEVIGKEVEVLEHAQHAEVQDQ